MKKRLRSLPIPEIRYFSEIGSTNDEALEWVARGAPDGALVIADSQSAGRGRFARRWVTRPGSALAFSLVLLPSVKEQAQLNLFSPLGALAVHRAIEHCCLLQSRIKWPNDILLSNRKVCGILAEAAWMGERLQGVVIGIGVNVASHAINENDRYMFPATTIETETGREVDREELLFFILEELFKIRPILGTQEFFTEWEQNMAFMNEMVRVEQEGQPPVEGILVGIDSDGSLRLDSNEGKEIHVLVGDVHLRPAGI